MQVHFWIPVMVFFGVGLLLFVRRIPIMVRTMCVLLVALFSSGLAFVGNLAPHRMARSELTTIPSPDWLAGAMATRDTVHLTMIFWILPVCLLVITCLFLIVELRKSPGQN